uniref:Uncharacterized protein n=1 Tax=Heterorhabditis bacteriophora TaxID=37862 RepID=A0A1I7XF28_HETBA
MLSDLNCVHVHMCQRTGASNVSKISHAYNEVRHSEESRRALAASKPVTCFEMGVWRIEEHTWNE